MCVIVCVELPLQHLALTGDENVFRKHPPFTSLWIWECICGASFSNTWYLLREPQSGVHGARAGPRIVCVYRRENKACVY